MRPLLIVAALWALYCNNADAGYANASPPPGWAAAAPGSERATYRAAANELWTSTNTVRTTATLNVGGRAVTMPAGFRMAANAGRYAGRFAFGPLGAAALILLPLAYEWYTNNG